MTPAEIQHIRETFQLSKPDLARALNVALYTVTRWERDDGSEPAGLQLEVLRALHLTALAVDPEEARIVAGRIALGIGALIYYGLTGLEAAS